MQLSILRRLVSCSALSVAASMIASPALSLPVSTSQGFVQYLNNNKKGWDTADKLKFNWLSGCFTRYASSGRAKAFVCTKGVVVRISPNRVKRTCQVNLVKVNRKGKITLTSSNCVYK